MRITCPHEQQSYKETEVAASQDPLTLSPTYIPFKEELTSDFCLHDSFYLLLKSI